jgi:predicted DNA binding CopG/RHH family protein
MTAAHTGAKSFETLGQAIGVKERQFMKKKIVYTDEHMGDVEVIADFLPSPAELAFKEDGVKVTLALSKCSVEFFKSEASKHHTQYQRMIRRLLDSYVEAHGTAASKAKPTVRKRAAI